MVRVVPPGQGGSPGRTHTSHSSGGGGNIGSGSGIPGFSGYEVKQTPNGPVFVGAVTNTGQLIRPGQPIPGRPGFFLSIPPQFTSGGGGNSAAAGAPGGGPPFTSGGGGGGGGFTPPVSVGGTTAGPSASSGLAGVLSKMFPFITDLGNTVTSVGSVTSAVEDFAKVMSQIGGLLGQFLQAVEILFTPTFWLRAVAFLIGLPITTYGLIQLGRAQSGGGTAIGMAATAAGLVFLFVAFHNLPDTVNSPGTLAQFLQQEIQGGNVLTAASANQPGATSSLFKPPITIGSSGTTSATTG